MTTDNDFQTQDSHASGGGQDGAAADEAKTYKPGGGPSKGDSHASGEGAR
ncbi:hypothetical protein [Streptomyces megasporus]|nr:hypothetical protein [Streptomyces megasporus]